MANTRPFRLEATRRLGELLVTTGAPLYFTTLPITSIFRGRVEFGDNDPLPMIVLIEPPIPMELATVPLASPHSVENWDILIQGFVEDDPLNPTDPAHYLLADVEKAIGVHKEQNQSNPKLGFGDRANTVEDILVGQPKVRPADEISAKAYFWLPVSLKVYRNLANPLEYRSA